MKYPVELLQIACIVGVVAGIVIEIIYGADSGFVLITFGSLAFGGAEKIARYRAGKKNNSNNNNT